MGPGAGCLGKSVMATFIALLSLVILLDACVRVIITRLDAVICNLPGTPWPELRAEPRLGHHAIFCQCLSDNKYKFID
jgi:hypothetical protein